jgi:hypothetical protein
MEAVGLPGKSWLQGVSCGPMGHVLHDPECRQLAVGTSRLLAEAPRAYRGNQGRNERRNPMKTVGREVRRIETRLRQIGTRLDRLTAQADERKAIEQQPDVRKPEVSPR